MYEGDVWSGCMQRMYEKPLYEKPTRVRSPTPHTASPRPCQSNPGWKPSSTPSGCWRTSYWKKRAKEQSKGIAWDDGVHKSVVESPEANCGFLRHRQWGTHLDSLMTRPQRYEEFHSGTVRYGIFAKSRYTGIFRYGISLIFLYRDFGKLFGMFRY